MLWHAKETVPRLSNGTIFSDIVRFRNQPLSDTNLSETVRETDIVAME